VEGRLVSERLERLVNLTATLLDTRRPLSLEELAARLEPSYPEDKVARRRAFERDKETLRDLGVPLTTEPIDGLSNETGYRIRPADYYLPDPGLSTEERTALHVAVTAVRLDGGEAQEGLRTIRTRTRCGRFGSTGSTGPPGWDPTARSSPPRDSIPRRGCGPTR
jgi:proteasome accessory factor B